MGEEHTPGPSQDVVEEHEDDIMFGWDGGDHRLRPHPHHPLLDARPPRQTQR